MQQSSQIPLQLFIYVLPVSMYKGFVSQLRRFSFFSPFFFFFIFFLSFLFLLPNLFSFTARVCPSHSARFD